MFGFGQVALWIKLLLFAIIAIILIMAFSGNLGSGLDKIVGVGFFG